MSPADMYLILAAELTIWSIACKEKFHVMNSIIGLKPYKAAPTPNPVNPLSVIGVSHNLFLPNLSKSPNNSNKLVKNFQIIYL